MGARRALLETEQVDLVDPTLASFKQQPRRGIIEDVETDALFSVSAYAPARRAVASPISFEPDEPLTSTRRLPRITAATTTKKVSSSSLKLRRGLLSAAAAVTAGAVLIVPNTMSIGSAQSNLADASDRVGAVSRGGDRPDLVEPITQAEAEARVAQAEREAEAARVAAERQAAEEAAAAQAEADRQAEEERIAAEQAAAAEAAALAQPEPGTAAPAANPSSQAAPAAVAAPLPTGNCAYGNGSSLGLTYQAQAAFQAICAQFPNVSSYGGWRGTADDHGAGQAIDIMISGPAGWDIANWLVANSAALGVEYVIYEQRCWGNWAPGAGFTMMEDRGSITQNHYDHVHVTIR